ncbi:MAG: hypothetical protein KAJ19_17190 [Gammaproteobacteria bacterium]|nr:hypothetical protein [Gammaproteobacteria bacterium]
MSWEREIGKQPTRKGCLGLLAICLVVLAVFAGLWSVTIVSPGTVGVVVRFGRVYDVFHPGLHFRVPIADAITTIRTVRLTYETSDHPEESQADYADDPVDTSSSDGQRVDIRYTIRFYLDPSKAQWIVQNFNLEKFLVERVVKSDSRSFARNEGRGYTAFQLYSGDVFEYQESLAKRLGPIFEKNGMVLDEVLIRSIGFDEDYIIAVENKQIAQETVKTRKHEAEQAEQEAQRMINLAYGEAQSRIEKAKGDAEAIRIRADAEAYSVEVRADAEAEAIRVKGAKLQDYPSIIQLETVQSLRDPNSTFKVLVLPQDAILQLLNLTGVAGLD